MNSQDQRRIASDAIAHLSQTSRGRRILALWHGIAKEAAGADLANSNALLNLAQAQTSHQANGTILDLTQPYAEQRPGVPVKTTAPVPAFNH